MIWIRLYSAMDGNLSRVTLLNHMSARVGGLSYAGAVAKPKRAKKIRNTPPRTSIRFVQGIAVLPSLVWPLEEIRKHIVADAGYAGRPDVWPATEVSAGIKLEGGPGFFRANRANRDDASNASLKRKSRTDLADQRVREASLDATRKTFRYPLVREECEVNAPSRHANANATVGVDALALAKLNTASHATQLPKATVGPAHIDITCLESVHDGPDRPAHEVPYLVVNP